MKCESVTVVDLCRIKFRNLVNIALWRKNIWSPFKMFFIFTNKRYAYSSITKFSCSCESLYSGCTARCHYRHWFEVFHKYFFPVFILRCRNCHYTLSITYWINNRSGGRHYFTKNTPTGSACHASGSTEKYVCYTVVCYSQYQWTIDVVISSIVNWAVGSFASLI